MIRKLSVICAAIALVATAPAHAQSKGTFLVEVGAGLPFYASQLGLDSKVGFGGRLGYMFSERIGIEAAACVFVDDLRENVTGAEAVGMTAILHRDPAQTIQELERLLRIAITA